MSRPLGRTQSAPLPLGHPMLQKTPPTFLPPGPHQYEIKHEHPFSIKQVKILHLIFFAILNRIRL